MVASLREHHKPLKTICVKQPLSSSLRSWQFTVIVIPRQNPLAKSFGPISFFFVARYSIRPNHYRKHDDDQRSYCPSSYPI